MSFVDSLKKGLFGGEDDYDDQYIDDGPQMVNNNSGLGVGMDDAEEEPVEGAQKKNKVFASMDMGTAVGVLFFVLVLFAALTSSIALTESAVSTFEDELGWDRTRSTILIGCIMIALGSLSALGYGPLASVTVFGMQFLDFFDFLTNSVMMPIAAIATCLLVSRIVGVEKIEEEVTREGQPFRRKLVFNFMLRYLCPIFAAIILASSVANALGWIAM